MSEYVIRHGKDYGMVHLSKDGQIMVTHPNEDIRQQVRHYLKKQRHFTIPDPSLEGSDVVGGRIQILAKPTDDPQFMDMAMCELFANTGVNTEWSTKKANELLGVKDSNAKADKPIAKSFDGTIYEIE